MGLTVKSLCKATVEDLVVEAMLEYLLLLFLLLFQSPENTLAKAVLSFQNMDMKFYSNLATFKFTLETCFGKR